MLHEDKRNFFRMLVNTDAHIQLLDSETGHEVNGTCRDLSATGMAVEVDEMVELNTILRVKIESSNNVVPPLDAVCKVVRVQAENDDNFLVGLEIVELN
jgi:c-di-GMP-binding flagellar brake protein YcgR